MKINTKQLMHISLFVAMEVILTRFLSISTPIVRIGFGFVPIAICAMLYGPVWAGVAGGLADLIGAVLFPIGAYFPGFTLSAVLTGAVFGLFLYHKERGFVNIGSAVLINCIGISLFLSTYWLTIITGTQFHVLLLTRVIQNLIMIPVQLFVLFAIRRPVLQNAKKTAGN